METFNYLRPIYYLITLLLIFNLLYLIILNKKLKINIYVFLNSIILTVIGLVLLFQQGIIIDEFNMSGDSIIFYLSIFFIIISIIFSLFTFYLRLKKVKIEIKKLCEFIHAVMLP